MLPFSWATPVLLRLGVMAYAQRLVAAGEILVGPGVAVAEGGGQGVGAVLGRGAAQRPERVLQAVGERDEALRRRG